MFNCTKFFLVFTPLSLFFFSAGAATINISLSGNDATGNGSSGAPYRTIQKGISMAQPGDVVSVGAGTFYEHVNAVRSGTATSPITIKGTRGSNNEWLTIIDASEDVSVGWQQAPEVGTGVWKKKVGFEPVALTYDNGKHAWRINSKFMSGYSGTGDVLPGTGQPVLAYPANHMAQPFGYYGCIATNFWDAIGKVTYGYDLRDGYTYVRFKNGEDPSTHKIRLTRADEYITRSEGWIDQNYILDATIEIEGKSHIIVRDFEIRGHWYGVAITGDGYPYNGTKGTPAEFNEVAFNNFTGLTCKVLITSAAHSNKVHHNMMKAKMDWISPNGCWAGLAYCNTDVEARSSINYIFSKRLVSYLDCEELVGFSIGGSKYFGPAFNNEVYDNTVEDGPVLFAVSGWTDTVSVTRGTKIYRNVFRNSSAQVDWSSSSPEYEFFDNLVVNGEGFRTNGLDMPPGDKIGKIYYYRNKFFGRAGAFILDNCCQQRHDGVRNIFFYHNSVDAANTLDFRMEQGNCENCLFLNNVMNSDIQVSLNNDAAFCSRSEALAAYDYNFHYPHAGGAPGCAWYGSHNLVFANPPVWSMTTEPVDWSLPKTCPARNSGIDLSRPFTLNGKTYPALPGMTAGYFGPQPRPNMGAVQDGASSVSPNPAMECFSSSPTWIAVLSKAEKQKMRMRYFVPSNGVVRVKVTNIQGQLIQSLFAENQARGYYEIDWDKKDMGGKQVSSGLYLCALEMDGQTAIQKIVISF